ncbi:MAG: polyketide synthase dehydratase domain-containing protein [Deltaproteobacteria bacterium]|nr:polyketide synthase dehydratase domain-containing protein [Deltaproteobacteria bacterium]
MSNVERPKVSAFFDMEAKLRAVEARLRRPEGDGSAEPSAIERSVERPRHPVLTRRLRTALVIFDGVLDAQSLGELAEYRQKGQATAPPALLLDLAQAAAMRTQAGSTLGVFSIESFSLRDPLPTDAPRLVQVVIGPDTGGDRVLAVFSQPEADPASEWTLHAEAFVSFRGSDPRAPLSESELRGGIENRAPDDLMIAAARAAGIEPGSSNRFEELWLGAEAALARIQTPTSPELTDRPVHPLLLDSALLLASYTRGAVAQPVGVGSIRTFKRATSSVWCRVSRVTGLVELRDEAGQLILEARDIVYGDETVAPGEPLAGLPSWEGLLGSFRPGEWEPEKVPGPFTTNGHLSTGGSLTMEEFEPLDMLEEVEVDSFDLDIDEAQDQPTMGDFSGLLQPSGDTWQTVPGADGLGFSGLPDLPPISSLEEDLGSGAPPAVETPPSVEVETPLEDVGVAPSPCTYKIDWVPVEALPGAQEVSQRGGWLIVSDDKPFGVSLAERFLAARQGCTFRDIAGTDLEGWRTAVKQLRARPERKRGIVFFAAAHRRATAGRDDRALHALLDIARAAVELDDNEPLRIWVVTYGARDGNWVQGAELAGVGQFLRTTHPWHFGGLIDCEVALSQDVAAARIAAEALNSDGEGDIRLTRETRLAARWVRDDTPLAVPDFDPTPTYFIFDCTVPLSLELVRFMSSRGAKNFVLSAARWPDSAPEYAELESLGLIQRVVCDLTHRARVDQVLALGSVGGVIYGGALTSAPSEDAWALSLSSLRGVDVLSQALESSPAFLVLLAKNAVFDRERVDTAITQGLVDAIAQHRSLLGAPARSLSFGPWEPVGSEEPGLRVLSAERALENVFAAKESRIVADVDWPVFRARFADRRPFSLVDPGALADESVGEPG